MIDGDAPHVGDARLFPRPVKQSTAMLRAGVGACWNLELNRGKKEQMEAAGSS